MSDTANDGLKIRRQVMGDDFVDRALGNATPFTQPLQDFINEHAWGSVWQRDGIDRKTRSLVTVAMLTALGRQHELKGHLRGALNNGASVAEIQEVLLHATVYCGVPQAADAFRTAEPILAEYVAQQAEKA
jgi:4-carboxymuconolactone decarboxylase